MRREDFLSRLRVQLGHGRDLQAPPAPHPAPATPAQLTGAALMERFVTRLGELEVGVRRSASRSEALQDIADLAVRRGWTAACGPARLRTPALESIWSDDPRTADLGLAEADYAIAETGTVVFLNGGEAARSHSLLPPVSCVLVPASRLMPRLGDVLRLLGSAPDDLPACVSFVSGPSNTTDINATRCVGVHGPIEVLVWIVAAH